MCHFISYIVKCLLWLSSSSHALYNTVVVFFLILSENYGGHFASYSSTKIRKTLITTVSMKFVSIVLNFLITLCSFNNGVAAVLSESHPKPTANRLKQWYFQPYFYVYIYFSKWLRAWFGPFVGNTPLYGLPVSLWLINSNLFVFVICNLKLTLFCIRIGHNLVILWHSGCVNFLAENEMNAVLSDKVILALFFCGCTHLQHTVHFFNKVITLLEITFKIKSFSMRNIWIFNGFNQIN